MTINGVPIDRSVNCWLCNELVDERTTINRADGGEICPDCFTEADFISWMERAVARKRDIYQLRETGYAVIVWSPEELGNASARVIEDRLVELGNECIEILNPEDDDEVHHDKHE